MGYDIFQRTKNRNEESTQLEESGSFSQRKIYVYGKQDFLSQRKKIRSFQAEKIRSGQRIKGKKAQKDENLPETKRCSEGLSCGLCFVL